MRLCLKTLLAYRMVSSSRHRINRRRPFDKLMAAADCREAALGMSLNYSDFLGFSKMAR